MDKLQDCISLSLRKGDIYAKYSISQFITLLPSNTYESANMVMERIAKRFHRETRARRSYPIIPFAQWNCRLAERVILPEALFSGDFL
jgi:GGDEF domain-containing protein